MKLHCLSLSNQAPCYLLEYKNVKILLDCAIEISTILNFLPKNLNYNNNNNNSDSGKEKDQEFNQCYKNINGVLYVDNGCSNIKYSCPIFEMIDDFSTIDVILLTNYTNIYSLPFITEYTNFQGKIFATEPTVQIGKLLLEELVQMDKQYSNHNYNINNNNNLFDKWQNREMLTKINIANYGNENEIMYKDSYRWKDLYKKLDIEKSFEKIQTVRFNESIYFYGFECSAVSSGFCLGSCNWVIEAKGFERMVYMSDTSLSVSRYPTVFQMEPLEKPDILILSKLNNHPINLPDEMFTELSLSIGSTLQSGGNVIIPSYSCGIILDLLEHLAEYLNQMNLASTQIYFISSVSKAVLSYADIYAEWLNKNKQERSFMPETPFLHQDLMKKGQLAAFQHIHSHFQTSEPCIIFAGHPSCRFGDVTTLIKQYGDNPKNTVFLIEPDFDFKTLVLPFSKLTCKFQSIPIDPRINFKDANFLISKLAPKHLIIPNNFKNFIVNKHSNGINGLITPILPLDLIKIKNHQKYENGFLDKELAQSIQTKIIEKPQTSLNRLNQIKQQIQQYQQQQQPQLLSLSQPLSQFQQQQQLQNQQQQNQLIHVAEVTGILSIHDHELVISPANLSDISKLSFIKEKYLWGTLSNETIINLITSKGFIIENIRIENDQYEIKINGNSNSALITTNNPATIYLSSNNVNIETNCEITRKQISDIIVNNCNGLYIN
ncbi:hypothetical protein DICPUDRAFT_160278 [Dictyostelium purpureum]|uniref:Beta-Casp domain-containing protein n=1 Tax=Dictyostelium purpureum TaxID=5786 RepID=F1A625_DICPU|nr:uncharacterized protein DICPUDRAFT_160278 [Dictyostelium purpureum]EGC28355.1 hypothetical protein DICPUDRAFT_160278 [Dictyostelium purpureum]|eukprot:XP_003295119.1 hypothetical protein DICPUDRAFT_160278 [Dictyostelium purpureum]